jgi:hypothetical protein
MALESCETGRKIRQNTMDDYYLTPEERRLISDITRIRIEKLEAKALDRLIRPKLTDDEKEYYRLIHKLKYDSEFQEIVATLLITFVSGIEKK